MISLFTNSTAPLARSPVLTHLHTLKLIMPLWRVYAHPATFTKEQKAGLAAAITKLYVDPPVSLPAFYVNVLFIPLQEDEIWIGGETRKNFVRITVEQIARTMPSPDTEQGRAYRTGWMDTINDVRCSRVISMELVLMLVAGIETMDLCSSRIDLGASYC